jgi:hypothetical protein
MHPPFGFALFYLRSVAPSEDYIDRVTKKPIKKITIEQIYWGAVPFVIIQLIMVAMIIAFPGLVSTGGSKEPIVDAEAVMMQMRQEADTEADRADKSDVQGDQVDPVKALMESMKDDPAKKP